MYEKHIVPKYFPERSDQFILLLTIRECLYLKLPQCSWKLIYAHVTLSLSCLYLKFWPLVYWNMFSVISGSFYCVVHYYLESWPQTGKFNFFFLWVTKYYLCHPLTAYSFNDYVFGIWFVYSTVLGAEKAMLSKVYVIAAFYTFNLVGQTDNHPSSNGESTSLVKQTCFPQCRSPSHSRGLISFLNAL